MKTRILLIDDHELFRVGVKRILNYEKDFEVVAEGVDGNEAVDLYEQFQPDVIIMDINMPIMNGVEATGLLVKKHPEAKVIILSIHDDENYVIHSLRTGAVGYLLKEMDADSLVKAVRIVSSGGSYLHPKITHNLVQEYQRLVSNGEQPDIQMPLHLLTRRECEVLQLLADGKSNRSIGEILFISEKTVKNHVSNILQKMDVNDRTQAVVVAIKKGWVEVR